MSFAGHLHESPSLQSLRATGPTSPLGKTSTTAAYGFLVIIVTYYLLQYLDCTNLPISELLWNSFVYITPTRLIATLDSTFEEAMTKDLETSHTGFASKMHASKSNAMRRFLGLDGAGLLTTVQRTRTLSNLSGVFKATPTLKNTPPGLGNWDNSCYQNSVLQGLAALESLVGFLNEPPPPGVSQPTKTALKELIAKLNDPLNVGKTFWTPAELKSMSSWQQQDAQEYFSKLSDELEKDATKAAKEKPSQNGLEGLFNVERDVTRSCASDEGSTARSSVANTTRRASVRQLPEELKSLIVRNPLEGLLAQRVGCQRCGYVEGLSLVPFNCLTVPLGGQWMYDVRTCLDEYTALEPINGVECVKCTLLRAKQQMEHLLSQLNSNLGDPVIIPKGTSKALRDSLQERLELVGRALDDEDFSDQALKKCQIPAKTRVSTIKSRQAVVARAPQALVIHVNRSSFDELTGVQSKNPATVRFPQQLDLAPWCLGQGPGSDDNHDGVESWNVDPSKSMLSDNDDLESLNSGKMYKLRAVVTHYGRHENGHYICYRKAPYSLKTGPEDIDEGSDMWWCFSDQDVDEVSDDTVLAQGGVFMLFYEQISSVTHTKEHQPEAAQDTSAHSSANNLGEVPQVGQTDGIYESPTSDKDSFVQKASEEQTATTAYPTPPMSPSNSMAMSNDQTATRGDLEPSISSADSSEINNPSAPPPSSEPTVREATTTFHSPEAQPSSSPNSSSPKPDNSSIDPSEHPPPATTTPKESQPLSPASMRTAAPRNNRGSVSRAGKAMSSVAGFVQAN